MSDRPNPTAVDELWRQMLIENPRAKRMRRQHRRIPSAPRCKLCLVPFGPPGGLVFRFLHHARWPRNPKYCAGCFRMLEQNHGGAEIECRAIGLGADAERRTLELKGKSQPTEVAVLHAT